MYLLGRGPVTAQRPERVLARFWVLLEECAKGNLDLDMMVSEATRVVKEVREETVLTEVAATLCRWFLSTSATQGPDPTGGRRPRMAELLRWMIPRMPDPAKTIFLEVKDKV